MRKRRLHLGLLMTGLVLGLASPSAHGRQAFDKAWKLCGQATHAQERRLGIPKHLLTAISLAESGRWDDRNRENIAWPWTVMARGAGTFFDTKAEAMAEVELLMSEGIRNIDVGCMQINMLYHADAFATLTDAFDPAQNAAYAAGFLKSLHDSTGDWLQAAGTYHSKTPKHFNRYRNKIISLWQEKQNGESVPSEVLASLKAPARHGVSIDVRRMGRLNAAFQSRKEAARQEELQAKTGLRRLSASALRRARQLEDWRTAKSRGLGMQHLMAMRKAETELRQRRRTQRLTGKKDRKTNFAERRRQQLQDWRKGRAAAFNGG